jgi:hypothetical protein
MTDTPTLEDLERNCAVYFAGEISHEVWSARQYDMWNRIVKGGKQEEIHAQMRRKDTTPRSHGGPR